MNTRDIASEYRLAHWAQVMRERTDRGLSIRAYCAETGIHENTYFYWQRKLREAACLEMQAVAARENLLCQTAGRFALKAKRRRHRD